MTHEVLEQGVVLLAVSVAAIALLGRLRLPPILGYLFVGVLVGPHALGWLDDSDATHLLGEIGVAFLLFTIGLEFSLPQFWAMRRTLLGLGGAQVLGGTLSGALIAWWIGIPWQAALVVGGALAMSSTAIVIKQLTDQLELQAEHGRLALGILLFQDLAAVPFLVMIPLLSEAITGSGLGDGVSGSEVGLTLLVAFAKGAVTCFAMLMIGRWVLRPLFHQVGRTRAAELFTLTVLLVSLAAAWITELMGLSLALGAFLAGMMLSETEYRHQIETDIRPFRDVLLGLFFVTVGMRLDVALLPEQWHWITLLVLGLIFGKGILIALLARLYGATNYVALRTGIVLGHGGEFGFALLALAFLTGLLDDVASQPVLAAVIVSMTLAPLLIRYAGPLAEAATRSRLTSPSSGTVGAAETIDAALRSRPLNGGHVIVCGFGRVGRALADVLDAEKVPYIGLDIDPDRIKSAWEAGDQVFFGDATHRDILNAVDLGHARALAISFDNHYNALKIVRQARALKFQGPILVRADDDEQLNMLLDAGATEVIPETLEAGLMLATQLLLALGLPTDKILRLTQNAHQRRYRLLRQNETIAGGD